MYGFHDFGNILLRKSNKQRNLTTKNHSCFVLYGCRHSQVAIHQLAWNPNFDFATPKRKSAQGNFKIKWLLSKQGDTIRPCFLACSFDQTHLLRVYLGAENKYEVSF